MKGTIFEIQKFALHDGPGIRTVVFLKGCPLKCEWCSNPESQLPTPQLAYDSSKCKASFKCVPTCPENALLIKKDKIEVDFKKCTACGNCVEACAYDALKIFGWKAEAHDIITEVNKDKAYFNNSGGGLTLSGGEPMYQFDFTLELLKLAKQAGLNTCIETAGHAPTEHFSKIMQYVDLFLYDYKLYDETKHITHTGISNTLILKNLDMLLQTGNKLILRCPIIPKINNTMQHFEAIASVEKKYPKLLGIELMPYHDWGSHKYEQLGMPTYTIKSKTVDDIQVNEWLRIFNALGCKKVKRG